MSRYHRDIDNNYNVHQTSGRKQHLANDTGFDGHTTGTSVGGVTFSRRTRNSQISTSRNRETDYVGTGNPENGFSRHHQLPRQATSNTVTSSAYRVRHLTNPTPTVNQSVGYDVFRTPVSDQPRRSGGSGAETDGRFGYSSHRDSGYQTGGSGDAGFGRGRAAGITRDGAWRSGSASRDPSQQQQQLLTGEAAEARTFCRATSNFSSRT